MGAAHPSEPEVGVHSRSPQATPAMIAEPGALTVATLTYSRPVLCHNPWQVAEMIGQPRAAATV